ncbi:MAG: hypothetical protein IJR70_05885 [Eubacterium sp.]|nr:hypothetical protein [Eubacterium sp.]
MFKITIPIKAKEFDIIADKLMRNPDPYDVLEKIDRLMTPYQQNMHQNDEDHRFDHTPYYMRDIRVMYGVSKSIFNAFCVAKAKTYFEDRTAGQIINHYVTDRYNFIHEDNSGAELEKGFEKYLADRGITEDEYFIEFLASCFLQEYSIIAQMLDTVEPFVNKSDIIKWERQLNYLEHTAREIVTENKVYQLV